MPPTIATDIPEICSHLTRYLATEGDQDSRRALLNARLSCHGMNAGYKLDMPRFEHRIHEYMRVPGLPIYGPMMAGETYEVPMYQLLENRDWKQLMAMCVRYRMNAQVVHSTLDVFTLEFGALEANQIKHKKYAARCTTPFSTYMYQQACVDMVEDGFFNFVAGIMRAYDRDVAITQKCVRVLYCMSTLIESIERNITPYVQIVLCLSTRGLGTPTAETRARYGQIMFRYLSEKRPPSTMPISGDEELLYYTIMKIESMITGNSDDLPLAAVAAVCNKVVDHTIDNSQKIKHMQDGVIGQAIGATVRWLRMSLQSEQRTHHEHQILALRFLCQLHQQNMNRYFVIMLQHGIAEVLVMGIAKNNARANALLNGQVEDAADIMRNQFAFYDLMFLLFDTSLDFTIVVKEFCNHNAFGVVTSTLQLAMHEACIFRFEFGLERTKSYQNVLPGALVAPYKTRCDGITPTYNISEMAVVLACRMSQCAPYGNRRQIPDEIFARNLEKLKRFNIGGIMLSGCRSFADDNEKLKLAYGPCSMDRDSFRQRSVSLQHIHRLAKTLGILQEYVENDVNRGD